MPNTPKGLTYPSSSSPVAVPADLQELATDVDGLIVPNTGGTYTGSVSFTQSPSVPTPTSGLHAVNKTYADLINTDVTALETELGSNPSGTFSTVADRLNTQDHPASTTDNTVARYDGTQGKLQTSTVVIDDNGRLTTVTGATGGYGFIGGAVHLTGTGSPESVITAPPGSTFLQTDSVVDVKGWIRWTKATGTGNTGWIAGPEADTGWRDVTASLINSWTAASGGYLKVRRIGNLVIVRGRSLKWAVTSQNENTGPYTLPSGFRGSEGPDFGAPVGVSHLAPGYGEYTTRAIVTLPDGRFGLYTTFPGAANDSGNNLWFEVSFITIQSWPTSLPGVAT